jgi:ribosome biogenesis protein Nip4
MKAIMKFAVQLGGKFFLNADLTVNRGGRWFLLNEALFGVAQKDFYYAGTYLGKVKNGKFFPSFNLLKMLAEGEVNKIIVAKKAAWLFICGRDVFRTGIVAVRGSRKGG